MISLEKLRSMEMCPLAGKCPPLEGIQSVKSSCGSGSTAPGGGCQLECEQTGVQLTDESYANLLCKEGEDGPTWFKENGGKVTLKEIKNKDLCNSNKCPIISGISGVKTNCSSEPSKKGDLCLLECEETGQEITEKEFKLLKCKRTFDPSTGADKTEWHTMKNIVVTVDELKSKDLCPGSGDKCPALNGITGVKTSCANETTNVDGKCQLECEQEGVELTEERFKTLVCKEDIKGGVSWHTEDAGIKVTLQELKDMELCPSDTCPPLNGITGVKTSCANETTNVDGKCQLECEQEGVELTEERFKTLVCKEGIKGGVSWHTEDAGIKVTLNELKNMTLCPGGGNKTDCPPITEVPRVNSSCPENRTPVDKSCQLKCKDSGLTINETYSTIDCLLLEDGSAEWHVNDVKTTVEELRKKELCPPKSFCVELMSWKDVSVDCSDKEDEPLAKDKVPKDGHCHLACTNGQNITDAYEVLHCKEIDGELKFLRKNDSQPIVREVLAKMEFCKPPAGTIMRTHSKRNCV